MNWLHSLMLGFVSGLSAPMPLSDAAGQGLLRQMLGVSEEGTLFLLACRAAVLAVLIASGTLELRRLRRTARLMKLPPRKRTGHPSLNESGTLRLLRFASIPALLGGALGTRLSGLGDRLWLLAVTLVLSGLLLWLSGHMPTANKDGRHLTAADGTLMGLGALVSAVPGISVMAAVISIGSMRGAHRKYTLRFAWMLLAYQLAGGIAAELLTLAFSGLSFESSQLLSAGIGALAAAAGAYMAVRAVRRMSRSVRFRLNGFCYVNWGQALLCLVLFLLV